MRAVFAQGAPDCLKDKVFVCTGELEHYTRDQVTALIAKYGGRTTGTVSGKTTHLLMGDKLEDGREVTSGK